MTPDSTLGCNEIKPLVFARILSSQTRDIVNGLEGEQINSNLFYFLNGLCFVKRKR